MGIQAPTTHPLIAPTLEEAKATQFRLMECISAHFDGRQLLQADYGNVPGLGRPETTARVERVLAQFFGVEACALVQGAGTGAIRAMLGSALNSGDRIIIHAGPPYATTRTSLKALNIQEEKVNFNNLQEVKKILSGSNRAPWAYLQHSRHDIEDSYSPKELIDLFNESGVKVMTDENYSVFKVLKIGVELGAYASTFSTFKMLGPEGIGCVLGSSEIIEKIHLDNYSGGGQVQGPQATDAMRSLVLAPVIWAVQAEVVEEVAKRLNSGEVPGISAGLVVNAQDKMILVLTEKPVADQVIEISAKFGAQNYPVGANSRYEVAPFIYRLSGANLESRPELAKYAIRVNPVRAGADQVISILSKSLSAVL